MNWNTRTFKPEIIQLRAFNRGQAGDLVIEKPSCPPGVELEEIEYKEQTSSGLRFSEANICILSSIEAGEFAPSRWVQKEKGSKTQVKKLYVPVYFVGMEPFRHRRSGKVVPPVYRLSFKTSMITEVQHFVSTLVENIIQPVLISQEIEVDTVHLFNFAFPLTFKNKLIVGQGENRSYVMSPIYHGKDGVKAIFLPGEEIGIQVGGDEFFTLQKKIGLVPAVLSEDEKDEFRIRIFQRLLLGEEIRQYTERLTEEIGYPFLREMARLRDESIAAYNATKDVVEKAGPPETTSPMKEGQRDEFEDSLSPEPHGVM